MRKRFGHAAAAITAAAALAAAHPARAAAEGAEEKAAATADFSGGGAAERASAEGKRGSVRLEMRDASGKRLARADAPAPPGGRPNVTLSTGSIGSAGTLLEVTASLGAAVCRSVWRFRDGVLSKLPLHDGEATLPDCEPAAGWSTHWDETRNEPARYVRESARDVPQGRLHESRVFVFVGFEMKRDRKKSQSEINGVSIPTWTAVTLYPKRQLENLVARFNLSGLGSGPRLRFETDPDNGVFAVVLSDPEGSRRLPVSASKIVEGEERLLELTAGDEPVRIAVAPAEGSAPRTASVRGAGTRFDAGYAPVTYTDEQRIEMYSTAEQELAVRFFPGTWVTEGSERMTITPTSGAAALRFGDADVVLRLDGAPEGTDLLLVPAAGGPPSFALALRGPNGFRRVAVQCGQPAAARDCRAGTEGVVFRRVGSQINVR